MDDHLKIEWLDEDIGEDAELSQWLMTHRDTVPDGISKEEFLSAFLRRALPRDFIWNIVVEVRNKSQGVMPFQGWASQLRQTQAEAGSAISDLEPVREMFFSMDEELRRHLQLHEVLADSGLSEDALDTIGMTTRMIKSASPPTTNATSPARVDHQAFERVARDVWDIVAARRAAVASQMHRRAYTSTTTAALFQRNTSRLILRD